MTMTKAEVVRNAVENGIKKAIKVADAEIALVKAKKFEKAFYDAVDKYMEKHGVSSADEEADKVDKLVADCKKLFSERIGQILDYAAEDFGESVETELYSDIDETVQDLIEDANFSDEEEMLGNVSCPYCGRSLGYFEPSAGIVHFLDGVFDDDDKAHEGKPHVVRRELKLSAR